jgi:hypothetical protein
LAFANPLLDARSGNDRQSEESDEDDDLSELDKEQRTRWLAAGGKDNRVSLWVLMKFTKIVC